MKTSRGEGWDGRGREKKKRQEEGKEKGRDGRRENREWQAPLPSPVQSYTIPYTGLHKHSSKPQDCTHACTHAFKQDHHTHVPSLPHLWKELPKLLGIPSTGPTHTAPGGGKAVQLGSNVLGHARTDLQHSMAVRGGDNKVARTGERQTVSWHSCDKNL